MIKCKTEILKNNKMSFVNPIQEKEYFSCYAEFLNILIWISIGICFCKYNVLALIFSDNNNNS